MTKAYYLSEVRCNMCDSPRFYRDNDLCVDCSITYRARRGYDLKEEAEIMRGVDYEQ